MGLQSNAQREVQLLAEWLETLPKHYRSKTNVKVGAQTLVYQGQPIDLSRARALDVWSDKADARVWTGHEVWLVEAKLVAIGTAYGQLMDYLDEYQQSEDYRAFGGSPVFGFVLCAANRPRTSSLFARYGIGTIVFTPRWALSSIAVKVLGSTSQL